MNEQELANLKLRAESDQDFPEDEMREAISRLVEDVRDLREESEFLAGQGSALPKDAINVLRQEQERLHAFAQTPAASKSGESIAAHDKVALLEELIEKLQAQPPAPVPQEETEAR